jgi:hypothetical protein
MVNVERFSAFSCDGWNEKLRRDCLAASAWDGDGDLDGLLSIVASLVIHRLRKALAIKPASDRCTNSND